MDSSTQECCSRPSRGWTLNVSAARIGWLNDGSWGRSCIWMSISGFIFSLICPLIWLDYLDYLFISIYLPVHLDYLYIWRFLDIPSIWYSVSVCNCTHCLYPYLSIHHFVYIYKLFLSLFLYLGYVLFILCRKAERPMIRADGSHTQMYLTSVDPVTALGTTWLYRHPARPS